MTKKAINKFFLRYYNFVSILAPQGSHPFDWSKRHSSGRDLLRNKFRIFRNQALNAGGLVEDKSTTTTTTTTEKPTHGHRNLHIEKLQLYLKT